MAAPTLEWVRTFLALARELHFSRTAETLGLSQTSVTRHIHQLELALGAQLLTRTTRSVDLTPIGLRFAARMSDAVAAFDAAVLATKSGESGRLPLRIGFTPLAASLIDPLQRAAAEVGAHPVVTVGWEPDLLSDLRSGRLAVVAAHALSHQSDFQVVHVRDEALHVVGDRPPDDLTVRVGELGTRQLVLSPAELSPSWNARLLELLLSNGVEQPETVISSTSNLDWSRDPRRALVASESDDRRRRYTLVPAACVPHDAVAVPTEPQLRIPLTLGYVSGAVRPETLHVLGAGLAQRRASQAEA